LQIFIFIKGPTRSKGELRSLRVSRKSSFKNVIGILMDIVGVFFNQDSTCFACATRYGFGVYNCDPPKKRFGRHDVFPDGLTIVEMLFKSNIFAIVGIPLTKLLIWDDFQVKAIAELDFKDPIVGVKMRKDCFIVATINKLFLYTFENFQFQKTIDTAPNPHGLVVMSIALEKPIICTLGPEPGSIIIFRYAEKIVQAHQHPIRALAITADGSMIATASQHGTLIRVWDTTKLTLIKELRRGAVEAEITSLCFNNNPNYLQLAVCSEKGTCHIFSVNRTGNKRSAISYFTSFLPSAQAILGFQPLDYFESEWSELSFQVPSRSICTFSPIAENVVYILTIDGIFSKYVYNTRSKEVNRVECCSIEKL